MPYLHPTGGARVYRSLALFLALAALAAATVAGARPLYEEKNVAVSQAEIGRHIRYLASDELQGRMTASPGAERAAEYIAQEFRRAGLRPAGTDGFFQHFPFVASLKPGPGNTMSFSGSDARVALTPGVDFLPLGFSSDGEFTGDVAFVGYGISAPGLSYDDYQQIDVKDKIVLALRWGPDGDDPHSAFTDFHALRRKALSAREHGARALLVIADSEPFSEDPLSRLHHDYGSGDSGIVAAALSRARAESILGSAGQSLAEWERAMASNKKPASMNLPGWRGSVKLGIIKETKSASNVLGLLQGSDPRWRDELLIIGAHYDHLGLGGENSLAPKEFGKVHNGADDNASGTSAVVELARVLSADSLRPKRSILFMCFSGEEEGVLGSNYYVKNPVRPLPSTVAMINMDMIGRLRDNRLSVQGIGTSPAWKQIIEELNAIARFDLKLLEDGRGPSDHSSFYDHDLPVLFFFTGAHEDYHKPSDDFEKINLEGETRVVEFVRQVALKIDDQAERPVFTKAKASDTQRAAAFRVSLGSIPDYAEQVEGVKLSGVREGSPAEKAGLRAGDVIVQLGRREIKNVYDYTYALSDLKAGVETEIAIMREGKRLMLKVIPERRQ